MDDQTKELIQWARDYDALMDRNRQLIEERDALKAALVFYADGITVSASKRTFIAPDDGTIARRALDGDV